MIEMVPEYNMTQTITQTAMEATKAEILFVREAEGPTKTKRSEHIALRANRPSLKWPTFN